jgi:cell pole-organizing protein PopZ
MSQPAKVQEPSMEEILASIRRIIADEDNDKTAKPPEPAVSMPPPEVAAVNSQSEIDAMLADIEAPGPAAPKAEPELEPAKPDAELPPADVLDLSKANVVPERKPAPSFRTIEADSDVVFAEQVPEVPPPAVPQAPEPWHMLISNATAQAVDSAFNTLAHTVLGQNARTLEDLVKEMLRPLLKSWLDDNLPSLVERIVRTEIERVSRGKP